jgi:TonB family protein
MFLRILGVATVLVIAGSPAFTQQPPKSLTPEAWAAYKYNAAALVAKAVRYPNAACADKLEGSVHVQFTASSDGRITSRRIRTSSGHAILDQEALQTIDRVKAVPPFPRGVKDRQLSFNVPMNFKWPRFLWLLKIPCNPSQLKKEPATRAVAPKKQDAVKTAIKEPGEQPAPSQ